jgi:hypothetical protein
MSFRLGSVEGCDVAILPTDWGQIAGNDVAEAQARAFVADARKRGKPTAAFFWHDSPAAVELDALVFRTSLFASSRAPGEFAQPAWSEDFVERYLGGRLRLRDRRDTPVVGFCGYAPRRGLRSRVGLLLGRSTGADRARYVRAEALDAIEAHPDVVTNLLIRPKFWAGAISAGPEARQHARQEYLRNIVESDYILCVRGAGNFSYRLYETLSCGRIPVFVDTDCVLPLEHLIDWRGLCVWVDESEIAQIGDHIAAFHDSLTASDFVDRQRECRRVWETLLSPQGFFAHFHEHFDQAAASCSGTH